MKRYYRIMLGKKSAHAAECFAGGYIGSGFGDIKRDVAQELPDEFRAFSQKFIPEMQKIHPDKSKIALGLWCGFAWTICKGIRIDDLVVCPDGSRGYRVGEVTGEYYYTADGDLPHRRPVRWLMQTISRDDMTEALRNSTGAIGTVAEISKYSDELQKLIGVVGAPTLISSDESVENPLAFALEEHLEDFLIKNWEHTAFGKEYDVYEVDGEKAKQYQTDTGRLDILAISKDKKKLLVVELKKGRASDAVVGQTLRYMSYVEEMLAENDQVVHGVIIALEDDAKIRRALAMVKNVDFFRYQISFKLVKG